MQQDDHSEPPPSAGQTIPYEDYSAASSEEEEGTTERSMKPQQSSKGAHKKTTKQQHSNARPSSKRSSSSISSSSSSDSSSSSSIFSSSDDDNSDASDDGSANKKKKIKKKKKAAGKTQPSSNRRRRGGSKDSTTADDGSINKLISVALKSQKKQYKNQIIQSVKSDLMNTLRSRIVHQQRGKKATTKGGGGGDIEDEDDETTVDGGGSIDKEYRKRIKQAYKEHEEGYDDAPKFNSKQHKKTIGSILSKLGEVNDIELFRIPQIDKEMGLDRMEISARDTKLSKKILSASPDKTIPEAVYAALKDAYSSCMLYKYFFKRIFPYITVPYITSVRKS